MYASNNGEKFTTGAVEIAGGLYCKGGEYLYAQNLRKALIVP